MAGSAASRHPFLAKNPRPEGIIPGKRHLVFELMLNAQSTPDGVFRKSLRTRYTHLHHSLCEGHRLPWGWERLKSCWLLQGR